MRIISYLLALAFVLMSQATFAAEPFGLKIGEAKLTDVMKTHVGKQSGTNQWTRGVIYKLNTTELNFEGLLSADAIFDTNDTLVGLFLEFRKSRFEELNAMTAKNYTLQSSKTPYVGDREAIYEDGDTSIELYSPHMSFQMKMYYLHDTFIKAYDAGSMAEAKETSAQENNALFGK